MKRNSHVGFVAALFTISLPTALETQAGADPSKPSPAQVSVQWEIVNVPQADWKTLYAKQNKLDAMPLTAAIQKAHYPTVHSPTVTTTDGVEVAMSTMTQVLFGPPAKRGFVSIGTETKIKPRVNPDGSVTLTFSLHDTELAGPPAGTDGPPPTSGAALSSTHTFRSGESAVLGGLAAGDKIQAVILTATVKAAQ